MKTVRLLLSTLLFCAAAAFTFAADSISVSCRPENPEAGEDIYVTIKLNISGTFTALRRLADPLTLPQVPGAQWVRGMSNQGFSSFQDSSGKMVNSLTFTRLLRAEKSGKLTIPPILVTLPGNRKLESKPFTINVIPQGTSPGSTAAPKAQDRPYAAISVSPQRDLRAGETVTVTFELFVPYAADLAGVSLPQFSGMDNCTLLPQADGHQQDNRFAVSEYTRTVNQKPYRVISFKIRARLLGAATLRPQAKIALTIREPVAHSARSNDMDDEFDRIFGSFGMRSSFSRPRRLTVNAASAKSFQVSPLPPPPAGSFDSSLLGNWHFEAKFKNHPVRAGEIAELEISGYSADPDADTGTLKLPALKIDDCRCYPPEIKKENRSFSARYLIVPLKSGKFSIPIAINYFVPEKNRYDIFSKTLIMQAAPGTVPVAPPQNTAAMTQNAAADNEVTSTPAVQSDLHYQFAPSNDNVQVPLVRNAAAISILLLAIGLAAVVIHAAIICRAKRNPQEVLRKEVRSQLKTLIAKLKDQDPFTLMQGDSLAAVAQSLGLPPTATASEIAQKMDDPELREFFSSVASDGFMPGAAAARTSAPRQKLIAMLKRLLTAALVLIPALLFAMDSFNNAGNEAFNRGDFKTAGELYRRELRYDTVSPALLYNLGNCEYHLGNLPEARLFLTRARLLAPGNSRIKDNLRFVEEKLQLTSPDDKHDPGKFIASCRDSLRPDHYMMIFCAGFTVLALLWVFRSKAGFSTRLAFTLIAAVMIIVSAAAIFAQCRTSYSGKNLILLGKNVTLRTLPVSGKAGDSGIRLPGGTDAVIVNQQGEWLLISAAGREGWIQSGEAMKVFPYGVF